MRLAYEPHFFIDVYMASLLLVRSTYRIASGRNSGCNISSAKRI